MNTASDKQCQWKAGSESLSRDIAPNNHSDFLNNHNWNGCHNLWRSRDFFALGLCPLAMEFPVSIIVVNKGAVLYFAFHGASSMVSWTVVAVKQC